jgi:YD repeat-containing protein
VILPDGMTLAATVCNTTPNMAPYSLWIAKGEREYLVDLTELLHQEQDAGLTGLTYHKGKIYVAVQSGVNPRILVFDRHLECVEAIAHPDFSDLHSLSIANGCLLVVSTGNQSVIAVDLKDHGTTTLFQTEHKIHANSVVQDATGLLVCCQSARHLSGTASQGGVLDVTNQRVILDGLGYPHSLLANGNKFIVLDSSGERVIRFGRSGVVQQQALSGFLRGAAAGAGCLFVAGSVGRVISRKHPQRVASRATWEALGERVCIHELDEKTLALRRTHFPLVAGFEIYELLVLEGHDAVDSPTGRLLLSDQYAISRAFYEAAKSAAAGREQGL